MMENKNNVPQWLLDSESSITEQNDEVGLIVAQYIGFFRKKGFTENHIGSMLVPALLLDFSEVERRINTILSSVEGTFTEDKLKEQCVFLAAKGILFNKEDSDPCEIIDIIKTKYGNWAFLETLFINPKILVLWKKEDVRDKEEYKDDKEKAEKILKTISVFYPEK